MPELVAWESTGRRPARYDGVPGDGRDCDGRGCDGAAAGTPVGGRRRDGRRRDGRRCDGRAPGREPQRPSRTASRPCLTQITITTRNRAISEIP